MAFAALLVVGWASYYYYSVLSVKAPVLPDPPLKDLAAARDIELGVLMKSTLLGRNPHRKLIESQFAMVAVDGEIHWDKFRPSPTEFDFSKMDSLVAFAEDNGKTVQAHHLVWTEDDSLPKWLKEGDYDKQQLLDFMKNHIQTVVSRYKGKVGQWTVVNEPFTRAKHIYGLDDWWGDHLGGNGYIDQAFRWAKEADPKATLILNDFYNETETAVSDEQYDYMKAAKARGVPIDAIGMQMHVDASRPPAKEDVIRNIRRFGELGYPTYITEFDISTVAVEGSKEQKLKLEAQIAADVVEACRESGYCKSLTVFGVTDRSRVVKWTAHSRERSLLFTKRLEPKPMYYAFREAWFQP